MAIKRDQFDCHYQLSSFRRMSQRPELFDITYSELTCLCHHAPPIRLQHTGAIEIIICLIDFFIE